jgi:hypothetical protein
MKQALAIVLFCMVALGVATGQTASDTPKKTKKAAPKPAVSAEELRQIRDSLQTQQQQIQQLQQQVQSRDQQIQQLQQRLDQGQAAASQAQSQAQSAMESSSRLQSDVSDLKANATSAALSMQETQKQMREANESPLAIHFKGITLTPGGFLAAESVWRQHGTTSDVNTPFNSIPYPGAGASHVGEWFGSGRQSRIALLGEGKLSTTTLRGYFETDWLSAGVTSNNNQSNSYTNRQRQIWGQAALASGWTFTGGQQWSLVTETKHGLDNRTEALPMTIDAQYHVGFSWTRQFGFRVTKDFGDKFWLGASVENAQALLTTHNNISNFFVGQAGTGGGLYNPTANYSFNPAPDIILKAAFEPGFGHYELFGLISTFRDRIYGNPAVAGSPVNDSRTGGGIGANARWTIAKHVDIGVHFLGGDGVGRYGTSTLPDVTVRPNGTLALIRSYQGLGTVEYHGKKWDWYFNGGSEYAQRANYLDPVSGKQVGYGMPVNADNSGCTVETLPTANNGFSPGAAAKCTADTRNLIEGTVGFWYRFYSGPKGKIQYGMQYSYVNKNIWAAVTGGNPNASENMLFTSFRYYLP